MEQIGNLITERDIDNVLARIELQEVRPASEWRQAALDPENDVLGRQLPWGKAQGRFDLRPAEVTIWGGESGAGKSLVLGQVIAWQQPNYRAMIASMEMPPLVTLRLMASQMYGGPAPRDYVASWLEWTGKGEDSRLFIYDKLETVPWKRMLAIVTLSAERLRLHDIVIDSLTMCGFAGESTPDQQVQFVRGLTRIVKSTGVHIHLVCHRRKGEAHGAETNKWDVRGPSELTDIVDNVLLLSRNREKEEEVDRLTNDKKPIPQETLDRYDTFLRVGKQRHHPSWEGKLGFFFHKPSGQLTAAQGAPIPWPDGSKPLPFSWRRTETYPDADDFTDF
ncbi:MAG: AAA family ATPase [Egibacteraceae bacterium]